VITAPLPDGGSGPREWAPLVDVSRLSLGDLLDGADHPALVRSVRRIVQSLDDPDGVISAFSSFVE
jgi:FXSXX-COOH protein